MGVGGIQRSVNVEDPKDKVQDKKSTGPKLAMVMLEKV